MAEPSETCVAWGLDGGVHEARNLKPMLTPEEQVELLKAKGVTFECCDERAAIEALTRKNTFMHLAACRRLFHKHREGPKKGKYIKLDFADLLRMDNLDTEIRHVFLLATQDAERLAKTAVIARASEIPTKTVMVSSPISWNHSRRVIAATSSATCLLRRQEVGKRCLLRTNHCALQ